jgi:hypothetical protein
VLFWVAVRIELSQADGSRRVLVFRVLRGDTDRERGEERAGRRRWQNEWLHDRSSWLYKAIKKSLCTWWLQRRKLQVKFEVSPVSLQTFIDTRLTLTPSVIPNYNYVILVNDWNCLKYFCVILYCNHQVHRDFLITLYVGVVYSSSTRCVGHVVRTGVRDVLASFWWGNQRGRNILNNLAADDKAILKWGKL